MPIEERIVDNGLGVLVSGQDTVSAFDIMRYNGLTGKHYQNCKYWLHDYSDTEHLNVSSEDIEIIADQDSKNAKECPDMVGAVVGSKDLIFGLFRMWESHMGNSNWKLMVFRSRDEAEIWIKEQLNMELTFN